MSTALPMEQAVKSYTELGLAGATLFILLVFTFLLFRFMNKLTKDFQESLKQITISETSSHSSGLDKLCEKIDALITSQNIYTQKLNEVLLTNDKDQETQLGILDLIQKTIMDVQRRVVRIDDRTFKCLGNIKKGDDTNEDN